MPDLAVIPTRNENLADLQDQIQAIYDQDIDLAFMVDDSDPGWPIFGSGGRWCPGRGSLGGSIIYGLAQARLEGADHILVTDAGGSHDPAEIRRLKGVSGDVVIGSRFCPGGSHDGPSWRSVGSRAYAAALNWLFDTDIKDWTSGYRLYSQRAVNEILLAGPSCKCHAIQAEMLAICVEQGCTVVEVPITYTVGSGSSFNWKTAREALGLLWRLAWNS